MLLFRAAARACTTTHYLTTQSTGGCRALHALAPLGARGRRGTGKQVELPKQTPESV